jgi:polysaccharide export outer membrane protein
MKVKSLLFALALGVGSAPAALAQQSGAGASAPPPQITNAASGISSSSGAAIDAMGVKKYLLGPGDVLDLRVFNEPQFNGQLVVDDEGKIEVPFVDNPISAQCRTDREIRKEITDALLKYMKRPQVSLRVVEMRSRPPATVFGAVRSPTKVGMLRRTKLLEVLAAAGSVTEQASGDIQIFHTAPLMCPEPEDEAQLALEKRPNEDDALAVPYSTYKILDVRAGKEAANPYVRPGDIIVVQEAYPIYVTGAVIAPNSLYLRENLSLSRAIAQVGGARKGAVTNKVRIVRTKPGGELEPEIIVADLDAIRKQKQPDIALKPYDIIDVSDGSPWSLKNLPMTLLGFAQAGASNVINASSYRVIQ